MLAFDKQSTLRQIRLTVTVMEVVTNKTVTKKYSTLAEKKAATENPF